MLRAFGNFLTLLPSPALFARGASRSMLLRWNVKNLCFVYSNIYCRICSPGVAGRTANGVLYRMPPPSYHSVTSFKPAGSSQPSDVSHSLINGKLMRSRSVNQTDDDSYVTGYGGIQIRRLQSVAEHSNRTLTQIQDHWNSELQQII